MKVYKERHLRYEFNTKSEYIFKKGPQQGITYNGPIIFFRGLVFAGEIMTAEVEKKWEIIPKPPATEDGGVLDEERHLVYDKLKPKYAKTFRFPKLHQFVLSAMDLKKGKYTRYFAEWNGSIVEISKKAYKYYKKTTTAYHVVPKVAEVPMSLDIMGTDQNRIAINEVAEFMPDILEVLRPHDFMEIKEFLHTSGDQLEYENGDGYVGEYHIHPVQGPMVGPVHTSTKHSYLYWSEKQNYRPKGLV